MVERLMFVILFVLLASPVMAAQELDANADSKIDTDLFSAYSDLVAESKIGVGADTVAAGNHAHATMVIGPGPVVAGSIPVMDGTGGYTIKAGAAWGTGGIVKVGATGVAAIASVGTDFQAALTNPVTGLSTAGYWPYFSDTTALLGSAVTASKVVCSDGDAHPVACTNLTDVVPLVAGGALGTPLTGTLTNCTGLPAATGVAVGTFTDGMLATTQAPGDNSQKLATTAFVTALGALKQNAYGDTAANLVVAGPASGAAATTAARSLVAADMPLAPVTSANGGTITANYGYYIATGTTTFTLPVAAAGKQFCFRQANAGTSAIKVTPASGDQIEKTDGSA
jgi:hypothetical protein